MIKLENVSLKFDEKIIFDRMGYTFEDNKIYGILGKSGCGKSSLLRMIAGLLKPNDGKIFFNENQIVRPLKGIFMMHQNYANFPWKDCLENVLLPLEIQGKITDEHEKEALETLEKVELKGYEEKYPYELSGGMNQRLALARTLISKPPVILMDEPLSALDPKTRNDMQNLVLDMHYKTKNMVIMVTHDPEEAKKMSNVIINL